MTRKTKLWLPILLVVLFVVCLALAACKDPVPDKCNHPNCTCENCTGESCTCGETTPPPHECKDKCSECGKCTSSCTDPVCNGKCPHNGNHPVTPFVTAPFTGAIGSMTLDGGYVSGYSILAFSAQGGIYAQQFSDEGDYVEDSATYTVSAEGAITISVGSETIGTGTIVGNVITVTVTLEGSEDSKDVTFTGSMYKANIIRDGESSTEYIAEGTPVYLLIMFSDENSTVIVNGSPVAPATPMPAQEVTIEIISPEEQQSISDFVGVWTTKSGDHTATIVAQSGSRGIVGYAVLDGSSFIHISDNSGRLIAATFDEMVYYSFASYNDTLIMTDGSNIYHFTQKTAVTSAPESNFIGKWKRSDTQKLLVEADGVAYYTNSGIKNVNYMIVGEYLVFSYTAAYSDYYYVLTKAGSSLTGHFLAPEKTPVPATFSANGFYTLKLDGNYVQFVSEGSKPTAISEPTAPSGKKFDGWVLAGTETAFSFDEVMTADASIEAKFVDDTTPPAPTEGEYTGSSFSASFSGSKTITSFTLSSDYSSVTLYFDDGTTLVRSLSNETGALWLPSNLQAATAVYEMLDGQSNSYYLCIFASAPNSVSVYNENYVLKGTFTKGGVGGHTCPNPDCTCGDSCTGDDCTCGSTQPSDEITISFTKATGATGTQASETWTKGQAYTLPACTFQHEGMTFLGWIVDSSNPLKLKQPGDSVTFENSVELIAVFGNVYTGEVFEEQNKITVRDDGNLVYNYKLYEYTVQGSVVSFEYYYGYIVRIELNESSHTFIALDELYGMSFTTNDKQHTLTFDGKGGAKLDNHDLRYEVYYDEDYNLGFTLTGADEQYTVIIEGYYGEEYINVKITIDGQDYVFGTPEDGPQLPEDADGTYKSEAGMTDLDAALGNNGEYAFTEAVLSGNTLTLKGGTSYPIEIVLTWTGNVGTGKISRDMYLSNHTVTVTVTEGQMVVIISGMVGTFEATFLKEQKTEYTVTFEGGEADSGEAPAPMTVLLAQGETDTILLPDQKTLVKEGYKFVGWKVKNSESDTVYKAGASFDVTGNVTLVAVWEEDSGSEGPGGDTPTPQYTKFSDFANIEFGYDSLTDANGDTIQLNTTATNVYKVKMTKVATGYSINYWYVKNNTVSTNSGYVKVNGSNLTDGEMALTPATMAVSGTTFNITFGVNAQGQRTIKIENSNSKVSVTWTEIAA